MEKPSRLTRFISHPGGKNRLLPKIEAYYATHVTYCDVFGGGGGALVNKQRSKIEVYNDLDPELVNYVRLVRDEPAALQEAIRALGHPRLSIYEVAQHTYKQGTPLERAAKYYLYKTCGHNHSSRTRKNGLPYRTGFIHPIADPTTNTGRGYWSRVNRMMLYSARLQGVIIEQQCFSTLIPQYDALDTLLYCDAPYVLSTLGQPHYDYNLTDAQQEQLCRALLGCSGLVFLSGYDCNYANGQTSTIYHDLLRGWKQVRIPGGRHARSAATARRTKTVNYREEILWINPRAWALHKEASK